MKRENITAIIPAFNEEKRVGRVLNVVTKYPFWEIIVVNDGSTDRTEEVIAGYEVKYVKNNLKMGKGYSMDLAVGMSRSDVLFFCDADVSGLNLKMIDQIVRPVLQGKVDMSIGMRNRKIYFISQILRFVPLLGGERALTKDLWNLIPTEYKNNFKIEAALNFYSKKFGSGFCYQVFPGLSQTIKEKKYGLWSGTIYRIKMYYDVFSTQLRLLFIDGRLAKQKRKARVIQINR